MKSLWACKHDGSFVTDKPAPNDVDVFLVMDDDFDGEEIETDAALLFDYAAADAHFGASVFWFDKQPLSAANRRW
ncbi:MAG: DUF6932 family protein [Planctomycetota bacterium]